MCTLSPRQANRGVNWSWSTPRRSPTAVSVAAHGAEAAGEAVVCVHQIPRGRRPSCFVYAWTLSQWKEVKCWAQGGPCLSDCWRPCIILVSTEGSASGPQGSPGLTYTPSSAPVCVPGQLSLCASLVPCPCVRPWSHLQVQLPDPGQRPGAGDFTQRQGGREG